jgi:hypothetical protein
MLYSHSQFVFVADGVILSSLFYFLTPPTTARCARIDLLDIKWFPPLKIVYNSFREGYQRFERPLPKQNPTLSKAHRLDCAFFNYATELLQSQGQEMEAIRAVFVEGDNMFPSSAIFDLAHIQIAVKNTVLIKDCQLVEINGAI